MTTVALVVEAGQEEALIEFLPTVKEIELELGLGLNLILVSDGLSRVTLEACLQEANLAGRVLEPPAWGETIGLEASEARLIPQMAVTDGLLLRLRSVPSKTTLAAALRRMGEEALVPQDWHPSHRALPPRVSGYSLGLIHCASCQVLLRSERGTAVGSRQSTACPGKPG